MILPPQSQGLGEWALEPPGLFSEKQSLLLGPHGCVNAAQLYFGAGSKLTVLGKEGIWGP